MDKNEVPRSDKNIYRHLQKHLDQMPIGFPPTESGIELKLLKYLFTTQQAEVTLMLSAVYEPISRIKRRFSRSEETVAQLEEILDGMYDGGLIRRQSESDGNNTYAKLPLAVGIYELQVSRLTKELEELFELYSEEAFGEAFTSGKTTQLRTIPVDIKLTAERAVSNYDDIRFLINKAEGPFAIMDCICKKGQTLLGNPCQQTNYSETCLTIGSSAERVLREGHGRELGRDETLDLLDKADEEGLVVQPQNTKDPTFICFCCGCCCHVLRISKRYPEPASFFTANYHAYVDADLCIACGACSSRCQTDAIFTDGCQTVVNLKRCIGCGLCVSTCPSEAISLEKNKRTQIPPKDQGNLYLDITKERYGSLGTAKLLGKKILGMKI